MVIDDVTNDVALRKPKCSQKTKDTKNVEHLAAGAPVEHFITATVVYHCNILSLATGGPGGID